MKLLLGENLSPKLVPRSLELFGEIAHVRDIGLKQADDHSIRGLGVEDLLRRSAVRITEFDKDDAEGVLTLRVPPAGDSR